jgi:hypothetical protein
MMEKNLKKVNKKQLLSLGANPKITLPLMAFWLCAVSRGGGLEDC